MKKLLVFLCLSLLLATQVNAQNAPELMLQSGAGYTNQDSIQFGSYGYVEARLMFGHGFRVGPYVNFTKYGGNQTYPKTHPSTKGTEESLGLSFDIYTHLSYSYSLYVWANGGVKLSNDKFNDGTYKSTQKTTGAFTSGGVFLTDDWGGWFGDTRLMWDYSKPSKSSVDATYKGTKVLGVKPWDKEALRIVLESGIKRIGQGRVQFEPLIVIGYGTDFGRGKSYTEIGAGVDLGILKEWYRPVAKVKIFMRQDTGAKGIAGVTTKAKPTIGVELNIGLSELFNIFSKNKK